jgi:hypothetical protein
MLVLKTFVLFVLTAIAEIVGCSHDPLGSRRRRGYARRHGNHRLRRMANLMSSDRRIFLISISAGICSRWRPAGIGWGGMLW